MATMPEPRTRQRITGDQIDAFLSRYGLPGLKVGGPVLSLIEAASESDFRSSQDIFDLLKAIALEYAEGDALDRIGADEKVPRIIQSPSYGPVTIGDGSFTKIATKLYQGQPGVLVGSTVLYVADASGFPTPGPGTNIYIGRGTNNYEGPLRYTAVTAVGGGTYWQIQLASGTLRYHNPGESVVVAQGGKRSIPAGSTVQTLQTASADPVQFNTLYKAEIPDGETTVTSVTVVASKPGIIGNIISGAIKSFAGAPFSGATVTNPQPFTNGQPTEQDPQYRERIRQARRSRAKGTLTALKVYATGVRAPDENRIVTSASIVAPKGQPATLYIDDGTGYEETSAGVAIEPLMDVALGGEQDFETSNRPVAKAFAATLASAPFPLQDLALLAFAVGGVITEHQFSASDAKAIGNATAYEVVASVNADPNLNWQARTINGGSGVAFFARGDQNEDIEVTTPSDPSRDAAGALGVPAGRVDTLLLYQDDRLLSKDGQRATFKSRPFASWNPIVGPQQIKVSVDGTPQQVVTIVDQDFINANTGYLTVGNNSLAAWAAVFNSKIAGWTVDVEGAQLVFTSNAGATARAALNLVDCDFTTNGMMLATSVTGSSLDYTLDRNTGQIHLSKPLVAGSRLSIGTKFTRAFVSSSILNTVALSSDGSLWFGIDSGATPVQTGLGAATTLTMSVSAVKDWGHRLNIAYSGGATPFSNAQVGDQVVLWDGAWPAAIRGAWRVAGVANDHKSFDIDRQDMPLSLAGHTATVLNDGTVLIAGGMTSFGASGASSACFIYDPTAKTFTMVGAMGTARAFHTATLLGNGKVLVVGGQQTLPTPTPATALATCELYDPGTKTWSATASLTGNVKRTRHCAGLLVNGKVLVAGGMDETGTASTSSFLYDPGPGTWAGTGALGTARARAMMLPLANGNALIAGGDNGAVLSSAELYTTGAGTWGGAGGNLSVARHSGVAISFGANQVLFAGGNTSSGDASITASTVVDLYNAGAWSTPAALPRATAYEVGGLMTNGKAVVAFGSRGATSHQVEDYNGAVWTTKTDPLGGASVWRLYAAGVAINNTLLVFGGQDTSKTGFTAEPVASVEIFDDAGNAWSQPEPALLGGASVTLVSGGITFSRASAPLQRVVVPSATGYTATSLATVVNAGLPGAIASAYRTNTLRVSTVSYDGTDGDIALVAADLAGQNVGIPVSSAKNTVSHIAAVETGNSDRGTPAGLVSIRGSIASDTPVVDVTDDTLLAGLMVVSGRALQDGSTPRYGDSAGYSSSIRSLTSIGGKVYDLQLRSAPPEPWMADDRGYVAAPFAIGPEDDLTVLVDGNVDTERFYQKTYRRLSTVGSYGNTSTFTDADAGNANLGGAFGYGAAGFDFSDFTVYMRARNKTHDGDATKRVLWRWFRYGQEGAQAKVRYNLPATANSSVAVQVNDLKDQSTYVDIVLGSGAARSTPSVRSTCKVGIAATYDANTALGTVSVLFGYKVASATADGAGHTTLTLTLPAGITNHGLLVGQTIYLNSNSGTWPSGAIVITDAAPGANTTKIKYNDGGIGAAGPTANIGDVTFDSVQTTMLGSGTVAGDFFLFDSTTGLASSLQGQPLRIATYTDIELDAIFPNYTGPTGATPTFYSLNNATGFHVYANSLQTATQIAAAVNALAAAAGSVCPITGTVVGGGGGVVDRATWEEKDDAVNYNGSNFYYSLLDGENFVQSTTIPANNGSNYQLTFKLPISSALASNNDWANEQVRIAPRTAVNVAAWLNCLGASGLSSVATIAASERGRRVQIASQTPGSAGSVEVQGGTANSSAASISGSSVVVSSTNALVASVPVGNIRGFVGGGWVSLDNAVKMPRAVIDASTSLSSMTYAASVGTFVFSNTGTKLWDYVASGRNDDVTVQIERQGNFVFLVDTGLGTNKLNASGVSEGDWAVVMAPTTPTSNDISQANINIFRVIRSVQYQNGLWALMIENSAAVEQALAACNVRLVKSASILPNDRLVINTSAWGAGVRGVWQVLTVGVSGGVGFSNGQQWTFTAAPIGFTPTNVSFSGTGQTLGSPGYQLAQVVEGTPARFVKQIISIAPNQTDSTLLDVKFGTPAGSDRVSSAAETVMTALDKLAFPTGVFQGLDGYRRSTGLIAEVNRVIYSDESDPVTYPGVAAASSQVNISGPFVKRVTVSLALRIRTGAPTQDIEGRVKSAVAARINSTPIGQSIALSDIVTSAGKVVGVVAVTVVSPTYAVGSDLIPVQPFEKPLVLDIDQDITISFVGE